jgi:hypothetical protein
MIFLEPEEVRILTGRTHKAKQIAQLRKMGIPFFLNAAGHPIVSRAAIEGTRQDQSLIGKTWRSAAFGT